MIARGQFVPFSNLTINYLSLRKAERELWQKVAPNSSRMRLLQNCFAQLLYLEEAAGQKAADILG